MKKFNYSYYLYPLPSLPPRGKGLAMGGIHFPLGGKKKGGLGEYNEIF